MVANKYRSVFISDVHLGTQASQADQLLKFIRSFDAEFIYLVGDIIDMWSLSRKVYWPQAHNDVIQQILWKARKGTKVFYITGNHDEFIRPYCQPEIYLGNIVITDSVMHRSADGKFYLVIHGDQFDVVIQKIKWLAHAGSWAYDVSIWCNTKFNKIRRMFGLPYWSVSAWLKLQVKEAVNFIGDYEDNLSEYAKNKNVGGVICGHIHHSNIRDICGISYLNCGDWVETPSAIVEHMDGRMELIKWRVSS